MKLQSLFRVRPSVRAPSDLLARAGLLIGDTLELTRAPDLRHGWPVGLVRVRDTGTMVGLPEPYRSLRDRWRERNPDALSHGKLSLRHYAVTPSDSNALDLVVDRTEWIEVKPIHDELHGPEGPALRSELWPHSFPLADAPLPNIGVIHGIVETSDHQIVVTQRSSRLGYHPGRWSISYEEQLEPDDLHARAAAFHRAAARGIDEEFLFAGAAADVHCTVLALAMELPILNPCVIVYVSLPFTAEEVSRHRLAIAEEDDEFAAGSVRFVPLDLDALARCLMRGDCAVPDWPVTFDGWHPTSRYRLLLALLHRFPEADVWHALTRASSQD